MELKNIRNFCIISHVDHGKSTLADRLLELTGTIEKRKMQEQVLDSMELERERGITIKMKPVRMEYTHRGVPYVLNLIDTPGHIDFSYEVSRALKAVEGCILLVDATQGVQAQTLSVLQMARDTGLAIIPAVNKIDSPLARVPETKKEIARVLGILEEEILEISGKTGQGVSSLLSAIIARIPSPSVSGQTGFRALVFDFQYSNHTGVIVFIRVVGGEVRKGDLLSLIAGKKQFRPIEVGVFAPGRVAASRFGAGEIGYLVTGIKEPGIARVGDTVISVKTPLPALPDYETPRPVVWASIYPESQGDFNQLRQALDRLRLSDASFSYEEESSGLLGRGFRCGFLGMLHLEIITERLRREFSLSLVVTTPSITYEVVDKRGKQRVIYSAVNFPEHGEVAEVKEPWVEVRIITLPEYLTTLIPLLYEHEAVAKVTENFSDSRNLLVLEMPLRELMRGFFDELKSASSGFASLSYKIVDMRVADVVKLELLVADEVVPAFSRVVSRRHVEMEAKQAVEKLHGILPRQLFATKIQGKAMGRIISSQTVRALAKDVTGYLYGGDRTRKMKLWQKQREGKKRLKERGRVNIPQEVFVKMMQSP